MQKQEKYIGEFQYMIKHIFLVCIVQFYYVSVNIT